MNRTITEIKINTRGLSDDSDVHDVVITRCGQTIRFNAMTSEDAKELCAKLAEAIAVHTVNAVESDH